MKGERAGIVYLTGRPGVLPCPFCGSFRLHYDPDPQAICCGQCYTTGPIVEADDRAIERAEKSDNADLHGGLLTAAIWLWNRRVICTLAEADDARRLRAPKLPERKPEGEAK
jgi:hypothetical protein